MPLIARQGNVREWHFAHHSRTAGASIERECEYSFFVSVRLMAKQLLGSEFTVSLPAYYGPTHPPLYAPPREGTFRFLVTQASQIVLQNLRTDASLAGVTIDISGKVGEYELAIYLTHPGRPISEALGEEASRSHGVIALSLDRTRALFRALRRRTESYRSVLTHFLANDIASKTWVYHPRYRQVEQKALIALKATQNHQLGRQILTPPDTMQIRRAMESRGKGDLTNRIILFECVMCRATWRGAEESASACPKCKTHLYRRVKHQGADST